MWENVESIASHLLTFVLRAAGHLRSELGDSQLPVFSETLN